MPGRTGISIYKEIKMNRKFEDIPVMIITGLNPKDLFNEKDYENLEPPDGFIEKPVNLENFLKLVKELTET